MTAERGWLEQNRSERTGNALKIVYYPLDPVIKAADIMSTADYKDTSLEKLLSDRIKNPYINSLTEDISEDGLSILTTKPLEIGQLLIIDLFLPSVSKPIRILCEIRNIDGVKGSDTFKAGLKFLSLNKSDLTRIENYLAEQDMKK